MMIRQNYDIMCEIGLEVVNGIVTDQDTRQMIRNPETGKYMIVKLENTYVDYRHYEEFNPYYNFKQLKVLLAYYLNKIAIEEDRYFATVGTDNKDDKVCLVAISETEEVRTRWVDKDKGYLAYIDLIYCLGGNYDEDLTMFTENREDIRY